MPTHQIGNDAIHYRDKGQATLLVLSHAFPVDSLMWQAQIDELSSHFRVVAPDFPGFGKSTGDEPFTIPSLAGKIHAFVSAIAPNTRFVLGGLSMGGYVAMNYAQQFPQDLAGLILADTKDAGDSPEQRENRNRMIDVAKSRGSGVIAEMMIGKMLAPETASKRPATAGALLSMMQQCPAGTIVHALAALRDRPDMTDEIKTFQMPTLILVGDEDALTPPDIARAMHKRITNSELTVIPGAGHMSAMEQPTLVSRAIKTFMAKLS